MIGVQFMMVNYVTGSGERKEQISLWPVPTCSNQYSLRNCVIMDVNVTIKSDLVFRSTYSDPNNYKTLRILGILNYLPTNLFSTFNKVESVHMTNIDLLRIMRGDFQSGIDLNEISIRSQNQLTQLEAFAFEGADNVKILRLDSNKINRVDPSAFSSLQKLETLDLSHNQITNMDRNIFVNNLQLRSLDLLDNSLDALTFISPLDLLEKLNIKSNRISNSIDYNVFEYKPNLKELILSDNCLFNFDLAKLPRSSLTKLSLDQNYIREFSIETLRSNFPNLKRFLFAQNQYDCVHLHAIITALGFMNIPTIPSNRLACQEDANGMNINRVSDKCKDLYVRLPETIPKDPVTTTTPGVAEGYKWRQNPVTEPTLYRTVVVEKYTPVQPTIQSSTPSFRQEKETLQTTQSPSTQVFKLRPGNLRGSASQVSRQRQQSQPRTYQHIATTGPVYNLNFHFHFDSKSNE